jgi:DNA helicase TIP49 (TBP-interacting protein)
MSAKDSKSMKPAPMHFKTTFRAEIPQGRNGKHKEIVSVIMRDLDVLEPGAALKVPIQELPDTKENIRSALNRATRKAGLKVATATDDQFLYIWNTEERA